jgi:type I restriction enzyme M protein
MNINPQLFCPIRGQLQAKLKAKDGLTISEEKRRIDCINFLISKGYPIDRIEAETIVLKFGHKGRNSLRADVIVYDCPAKDVPKEDRRAYISIVCEIKRDSKTAESAKQDQLKPALNLITKISALGIYWDDKERTLFYKVVEAGNLSIKDLPLTAFPSFGAQLQQKDLFFSDLQPASDLTAIFSRLDDILHQAGHPTDDRYQILFKLLLLKIYDEKSQMVSNERMLIQDFSLLGASDDDIKDILLKGLEKALLLYGPLLPRAPKPEWGCEGSTLRQIVKLICPINILKSSPQVLQDFFMYFGEKLFKVDLGQYFTPYEVIELVVRIVNPRFDDRVVDLACGTADFLVGAKRVAFERYGVDISSQLHGVDTAPTAVNLSVFNMILNGDGSSKITVGDSLKNIKTAKTDFSIALCNPPFGSRIREERQSVLREFELGKNSAGEVLESQETGILFVEACLRAVRGGGRVGIILPNGYLGNRSSVYVDLRRWILRHARIAAVIGFPRFTFKKSGADVSASVVILEKRENPLPLIDGQEDYPIHFNMVEKVGWDLRSNRGKRVFKRDQKDGSLIYGDDEQPIIDADFANILGELYSSTTVQAFPWLSSKLTENPGSWVVQSKDVLSRADLSIDPKRWSSKYHGLVKSIKEGEFFSIGDVLEPVVVDKEKKRQTKSGEAYRYVEIEKIFEDFGAYIPQSYLGWELPDRAKLVASPGDIFIANIWSSAGKWMIAGQDAADGRLRVTTGCTQFKVKETAANLLPDLVFGLSSEAFRVQMRALATGSDGLSSVHIDDILEIILPRIADDETRKLFASRITAATSGTLVLSEITKQSLDKNNPKVNIPRRGSHVVQV